MIRRLWHWLFGHRWVEHSAKAFARTGQSVDCTVTFDAERYMLYGFTDIDFFCHCGAHKRHRLVGQRETQKDAELSELRRMAKL